MAESNATGYPARYRDLMAKRHVRRLGDHAGLKNYGVNQVRIEPGGQSSSRHAHTLQDEIILAMEGSITLETDDGREVLSPGTWVGFPAGTGLAHRLLNETDRDVVFLVVGDRTRGDTVTYPELDMIVEYGSDGQYRAMRKDGTPY